MALLFRYKDHRAEMFQEVFTSVNVATALRSAADLLKNGSMPAHYAADFSLYQVAEEDPASGRVLPLDDPKHIIDLVDLLPEVNHGEA